MESEFKAWVEMTIKRKGGGGREKQYLTSEEQWIEYHILIIYWLSLCTYLPWHVLFFFGGIGLCHIFLWPTSPWPFTCILSSLLLTLKPLCLNNSQGTRCHVSCSLQTGQGKGHPGWPRIQWKYCKILKPGFWGPEKAMFALWDSLQRWTISCLPLLSWQ